MSKLNFNSISADIFKVNANSPSVTREDIIGFGRLLLAEYTRKGVEALRKANNNLEPVGEPILSTMAYKELNEKFRNELFVYAARKACEQTGATAPESFEEFKNQSLRWYGNAALYKVLQEIFTEIITPILPAVYSEAVDAFADVVEVNFGETAQITVTSNDIPVFQDTAWGALRSTPANYFYDKDYVLNPRPKTALVKAKWYQLVANNMDFGRFMANLEAGMYADTMAMWNKSMLAAAADTALVPSAFSTTFSSANWAIMANKVATQNNTVINNVRAFGSSVALSKILPSSGTATMDAALATLLGQEYVGRGYLGEFLGVTLNPLQDAMVPGTYTTVLPQNKVWMLASNAHKPMTIAYNAATPLTLEIDPMKAGDMEMGIQLTISTDIVGIFADKCAIVTIS